MLKLIKKYRCPALAAILYIATLAQWYDSKDMDILSASILNYGLIFPMCGIVLGIYYGRCASNVKWILPACVFIAVMIHDILVGYFLFARVEFDPGQIPMYLWSVIPCVIAELIAHFISVYRKVKRQ